MTPDSIPGWAWRAGLAFAWAAWMLSWAAAAFWASRAQERETQETQRRWLAPTVLGAALLALNLPALPFNQVWTLPRGAQLGCFAVVLLAFAYAWWARIHLGRLWSGHITLKPGHRIVDTGPYRITRHPIYTGLLLSVITTGLCLGRATALAGAALIVAATVLKARAEEEFLRRGLGPDVYNSYVRRTPMLVPFWPVRG